MLYIIKNNDTSTKIFSNYSIRRDGEFIGSAILTHDTNSIEVFKKHNKHISSKEYETIIKMIRQ